MVLRRRNKLNLFWFITKAFYAKNNLIISRWIGMTKNRQPKISLNKSILRTWMSIVERYTIFPIRLVIRRSIVVSLISSKCLFQEPPFAKCHGQDIEKCQHIVCVSKHLICFTLCEKYYVCMIVWLLLFECSVLEFMQTFSCFVNVCRSIYFPQLMER